MWTGYKSGRSEAVVVVGENVGPRNFAELLIKKKKELIAFLASYRSHSWPHTVGQCKWNGLNFVSKPLLWSARDFGLDLFL